MTDNDFDVPESGIAVLSDADPTIVHGVAIGEGDRTTGMSGVETEWPSGPLKEAAGMLKGKPLVKNHPGVTKDDSGLQVDSQPPIEDVIGKVTDSKYRDGVGLLFEAEVDDEDIANQIERGRADVSPVVARSLRQTDNGTHVVESIDGFRDLGVVTSGASPSNSIQTGAAAMMAEALQASFGGSLADEQQSDEPAESGTDDGRSGRPHKFKTWQNKKANRVKRKRTSTSATRK